MNKLFFLAPLFLVTTAAFAADTPQVPADPIARKKDLLFSDDFKRPELGKAWTLAVPTFTLEDGILKGTQTRVTTPADDGKPAVVGHQAVIGTDVPTKDSVIEVKIKFGGATSLSVEFDDRKYEGSHYGHICYARVKPTGITLEDQRDGSMRSDIYKMGPDQKEERNKLLKGRSITFPLKLDADKWYTLEVETVNDEMRVSIDGKPVAFFKSSGIAHPTKSRIELGCGGKDGYFDAIKIWNAEPAKP